MVYLGRHCLAILMQSTNLSLPTIEVGVNRGFDVEHLPGFLRPWLGSRWFIGSHHWTRMWLWRFIIIPRRDIYNRAFPCFPKGRRRDTLGGGPRTRRCSRKFLGRRFLILIVTIRDRNSLVGSLFRIVAKLDWPLIAQSRIRVGVTEDFLL